MGVETISLILAAFVDGSLGIAALMRNFRSRLCVAFAALAVGLFAHDSAALLEGFTGASWLGSLRVHLGVTLALGPLLLWFLGEVVPRQRARARRWGNMALGVAAATLVLVAMPWYPRIARLLLVSAHLGFLGPALVWVWLLSRAEETTELTRERLRLRYALWGAVLTIALYLTDAFHFAGARVAPLGTLARVLYLVFLFQTFVQKELMTAEEAVAKIALFGGIALMLSSIYSMLVIWVGSQTGLFFFNTLIASFVSIILFDPIRSVTSRFTRKLFLRRNAALEDELNVLSSDLMGTVEPGDLARRLEASLRRSLGVDAGGLFLVDRDGHAYLRVGPGDGRFPPEITGANPLIEYMSLRRGRPFVMETIESDRDSFHSAQPRRFCESCLESMRKLGADFIIPYLHESRLVGFTAVRTGERSILSNEQLRLFVPVSRQIALILKNAEAFSALRDRDKLAAVGEMAAGLAHEIKNPLGAIKGAAQLLGPELRETGGSASEYLQIIVDETNRLSGVLTDFLDYAKPRRNVPQSACDPVKIIEHTAALALRDSAVKLEIQTERAGLTIETDPEALKQVLLNLFLNALQAMDEAPAPGHSMPPSLTVRLREIRPRRLFQIPEIPLYKMWEGWQAAKPIDRKAFVEIEVADNGPGIPEGDLTRIFVPFYTTKPGGTGLGLAICQRIVEGMGGTIHVRPNRPHGTVFVLSLPVRREEPPAAAPEAGRGKAKEVQP